MPYGPSRGYSANSKQAAIMAARNAPVIPTTNMRPQNFPNGNQAQGMPTAPQTPRYRPQPSVTKNPGSQMGSGAVGSGVPNSGQAQTSPDDAAQTAFMNLLQGGPRDTSGDIATINQQMNANIGQNSANTLAGMAAGGFGMSGAAASALGDVRTRAARDASNQIMGVNEQARQDYVHNVEAGLQAEMGDRKQDLTDQETQQYMQLLNQMTQQDNSQQAIDNANSAAQSDQGGYNTIFGFSPVHMGDKQAVDPSFASQAVDAGGPPLLAGYVGSDANYDYYVDEVTGKKVRVKKS